MRRGVGRAAALTLIAALALVGVVVGVDAVWQPRLGGPAALPVAIGLALAPAALWLVIFYLQDRHEPEPKADVARIFVIGLALAGALGLPLVQAVFRLPDWQYRDAAAMVLGAVFIGGAVSAFVIYATLRYFIFDSPHFNERTDGVLYGAAAGLGYATALNGQLMGVGGGIAPGASEATMTTIALAHAVCGGVLGYFLGRARLDREPAWWLPAGLMLTAVLSAAFSLARTQIQPGLVTVGGFIVPPLAGLAVSAALALATALVVLGLVRRDVARALAGQRPAPPPDAAVGHRIANLAVIATFALCLIVGGLAWQATERRVTPFAVSGIHGAYPAHFSLATRPDELLRVVDLRGTQAEFSLRILQPPTAPATADAVLPRLTAARTADYDVYRALGDEETVWKGRPARVQRFGAVKRPTLQPTLPSLVEGLNYVILDGDRAVVAILEAPPAHSAAVEEAFWRFVDDLAW